jgi:uncharacterized protein (DUF488 family)
MDLREIFTVGHSTRPLEELLALLESAGVRELVDVRRYPGSRRHPQFDGGALAHALAAREIAYTHEPALGGFRRGRPDSPNRGWTQAGFAGYADHMASEAFASALDRTQQRGRERPLCLMCAEAQWWRCHRRLISDALLVRGWRVLHLGQGATPLVHELTSFAQLGADYALTYPPAQAELAVGAGFPN